MSYLEEWKNEEKQKLTLYCRILEGLKITGLPNKCNIYFVFVVYSFIEAVNIIGRSKICFFQKNLIKMTLKFYLLNKGHVVAEVTTQQYLYNTQAIRTTRSLSLGFSSNIKIRKLFHNVEELSEKSQGGNKYTMIVDD